MESSSVYRPIQDSGRPDCVRDLRIVLIGKKGSENIRVGNTILDEAAFQSEISLLSKHLSLRISGDVDERNFKVINTSHHLLNPHLQQNHITQTVSECVSQSAPGPHVILVVLQFNDFTETDRHRVKDVLNLFSKQAINHTIVLTTDEETRFSKVTSMIVNNSVRSLIKECGGGHLKFDETPGWRSELFRKIEEILKDQQDEFLICDLYEGRGNGSSVDGDPENYEDKCGGKEVQSTKPGSDERVFTSGKSKLNVVLCGNNATLKKLVSKMIRGTLNKPMSKPQTESKECVKKDVKINGRQISVIELPALTRLSEQEVMQEIHHCLSLCDPGVHLFILVAPVTPLTNEDEAEMEKINRIFNSKDNFMVLFTADRTVDQSMSEFVSSTESQRIVSLYGSWYSVMGLKDHKNSEKISKILNATDQLKTEPYSLQMFLRAQERRIRHDLEQKLSVKVNEIRELQQKIKTLEDVKLNLVMCGRNRALKSFISNLFLNESERGSVFRSLCVRREVELNGRQIHLVELPDLINTGLSEEEVMRQTLRCVSLCHPGVHLFLLIIPDAPLTDEDRAETEEIHKIFSSKVNKHMMILIKQSSGDKKRLDEKTQAVIQRFGGRQHFIEQNTQVSTLMKDIEQKVEENGGEVYSIETFLESKMENLLKYNEIKKRIDSLETWFQLLDSKEREDELRIVLLGKTGIGKSATANTIIGTKMFKAETSHESVTKECQKQSAELNGRHITVIDTPGLFDTELTNEEIKREISHCISMVLPGPHVFIIVISLGQRFTQEEQESVKIIQQNFGENSYMYTIVLFTRGDELKDKTIHQYLGKPGSPLKRLIETCGNRVHVFNNNLVEDRTQVTDLLVKIDHMVKTNGGSYYSSRTFREMERGIQDQKEKILMEKVERLMREREELVKKHKEETERMMGEERQKYDKERTRREEEFREREEQHKRDITDIEERGRKIREELKKEREEWERQKLEERQREEEEKEIIKSNELNTGTPEGQHTKNDEDFTDPECLRILLFGRTGTGKSATGNTILGKKEFPSEAKTESVITMCQKGVGDIEDRPVAVVDTPDLFDATQEHDEVVEEILKCVSLSAPGPHVFIFVLSLGKFTQEDRDTFDMIKMIFGPKAAEFSIVLFTRGESLKRQTIEQYVKKSDNADLKKLISDCGNRFLAFKNKETEDRTQVTELLNMIDEVKKNNQGQYFSNGMFEEAAISVEEKMKILEENERRNLDLVEELKTKYEKEIRLMRWRLEEQRERTDEERVKLEMKFREREEKLWREFEEKEKSEQKKREEEDQKRSELEKQLRDECEEKQKMKREIEDLRSEYEKQRRVREDERRRQEKYKEDQEKMKKDHENIIAELRKEQEEEIKKRNSEEERREKQEEKEREEWRRKTEEAESEEKEMIEEQQREWEEEKKREMREREEEERKREEKHEKQLKEKREELEKMRAKVQKKRDDEKQHLVEERQELAEIEEKEREYEEKLHELKRQYEQLQEERKEEWKMREEDKERRKEKRRRWEKMIEDLKREQEEEIRRREREERERIEREEKLCEEMMKKHHEEIQKMKKKHEDEAGRQTTELHDFEERKKKHVEEFKGRIEEELNKVKALRRELKDKWECHVM